MEKRIHQAYHGIDQALVAVTEIGGEPSWGLVDGLRGPLPIGKVQRFELAILLGGVLEPGATTTISMECLTEINLIQGVGRTLASRKLQTGRARSGPPARRLVK